MALDLARVKAHLRVTHDLEDVLITSLISAARARAHAYLERTTDEVLAMLDVRHAESESLDEIKADATAAIEAAILMIVGTLYANRDTQAPVQLFAIPHSAEWLLDPYRVVHNG